MTEIRCEMRVTLGRLGRAEPHEVLHLNQIITEVDLDEIMPPRGPVMTHDDQYNFQRTAERRERFISLFAAQVAQALTEGIFKRAMKA